MYSCETFTFCRHVLFTLFARFSPMLVSAQRITLFLLRPKMSLGFLVAFGWNTATISITINLLYCNTRIYKELVQYQTRVVSDKLRPKMILGFLVAFGWNTATISITINLLYGNTRIYMELVQYQTIVVSDKLQVYQREWDQLASLSQSLLLQMYAKLCHSLLIQWRSRPPVQHFGRSK